MPASLAIEAGAGAAVIAAIASTISSARAASSGRQPYAAQLSRQGESLEGTSISECFAGVKASIAGLVQKKKKEQSIEEFQELLQFLGAVPLFRKQLPRDELPKVAAALKEVEVEPGEMVIQAGKEGRAFYIIKAGEAAVMKEDANGEENEVATLYSYDYFGGRTLTEKRPNVATIVAKGPLPLVLLTLSREDFQNLGFDKKLRFARRPAIYEGRRMEDIMVEPRRAGTFTSEEGSDGFSLTSSEVDFVVKAVLENQNLRTLERDETRIRQMAKTARRMQVSPDTDIATGGKLGHEFFVISIGSFDLYPNVSRHAKHQSAEAVLNSTTMTERLVRKQQFLMGMLKEAKVEPRTQSVVQQKDKKATKHHWNAQSVVVNRTGSPASSGSTIKSKWHRASEIGNFAPAFAKSFVGKSFVTRINSDQTEDEESPFQVGDKVAQLVLGWDVMKEMGLGKVAEVLEPGPFGRVSVQFPDGLRECKVQLLRPVDHTAVPMARLRAGECYGELALLYHTRHLATCRATEPSVVYAISWRELKKCFSRDERSQEKSWIQLLDEVHLLNPLLRSERAEVARNAVGSLSFKPNEMVFKQGEIAEQLWYVVEKGSCKVTRVDSPGGNPQVLTELRRGGHFGERAIFREMQAAEFSVQAGSQGMSCLVIDGEILKRLGLDVGDELPGCNTELTEYHRSYTTAMRPQRDEIPFAELKRVAILGEGGFGAVYLCQRNDMEYALKRLSKGYIVQADAVKQVCTERDILSLMNSEFIIRFHQSYKDAEYVYMLLELCEGGHLFQLLCDQPKVLLADHPRGSAAMFFCGCVTLALEYLHERRIAYRDLKLENVLLDSRGYAKLCDLGFARFVLGKTHTLLGTPEYMAPEMIDPPHGHDRMVDWWALGVMAFELLSGQAPWDSMGIDDDPMGQLVALRESHDRGLPDGFLPSSLILARDFIKKLLNVKPERRLGAKGGTEVKTVQWFKNANFNWEALTAQTLTPPYKPPERTHHEGELSPQSFDEPGQASKSTHNLFVENTHQDDWAADF